MVLSLLQGLCEFTQQGCTCLSKHSHFFTWTLPGQGRVTSLAMTDLHGGEVSGKRWPAVALTQQGRPGCGNSDGKLLELCKTSAESLLQSIGLDL